MTIDELLVDFDEMGFAPTTLCENPDEYACEWKRQLLTEIEQLTRERNRCAEMLARLCIHVDELLKEYEK